MRRKLAPLAALSLVLAAAVGAYVVAPGYPTNGTGPTDGEDPTDDTATTGAATMATFGSAAEFTAYLRRARTETGYRFETRGDAVGGEPEGAVVTETALATAAPARVADAGVSVSADAGAGGGPGTGGVDAPDRYSGTNVQERGIQEPDVVKTDGTHVYFAGGREDVVRHEVERTDDAVGHPAEKRDDHPDPETRVIEATPPGTAGLAAKIDHSGRLLLTGDRLVVIGEKLWGYDVSDPGKPELTWTRSLQSPVETARLRDGTLYLVLASEVERSIPCPIEPVGGATVQCTEIYRPDRPVPVDVTYTAMTVDPATGDLGDELSFVGSRDSTVYMSNESLYVTYTESKSRPAIRLDFLLTDGRDVLDESIIDRLEEIRGYDLSPRATAVEVSETLERWLASLEERRRETVQMQLRQRFETYVDEHRRSLTTTHIVRIDAGDGLSVAATGAVPGRPLDQFSLDEHEGHLRIATTVGERPDTESVNDVYVLDAASLSVTGSVTGMGETERIYSVRFVGDRGYVVTFRRVDPFHVLDLSAPSNPTEAGQLKLPGYSSYLHPLSGDRVLGIGEEDGQVKTVVFDVSDPTDPTIEESRVLAADWSAISRTHHAFLLDTKHDVFFLPTEHGGTVLSSKRLETVHTVAIDDPQRALYIEDFLYVFGGGEVVVVNERNWTRADTLEFG